MQIPTISSATLGSNVWGGGLSEGTKWTVPIGGAGRTFRVGALPVDLAVSAYYNVVRPEIGPRWQLSTTLALVF